MNEQIKLFIFFAILFSVLVSARFMTVYGQTNASATINAQVKISICGNATIEGGEDCEGSDLNGKTCSSLGYSSGTLSCDVACTFDTYACIAPTPTPTPTSSPSTPTPTPTTPVATSTPTNTPTSAPTTTSSTPTPLTSSTTILPSSTPTPPLPTSFPSPTPAVPSPTSPPLPDTLKIFDITGSGKISKETLPTVVKLWVDEWKVFVTSDVGENSEQSSSSPAPKKCDLNRDNICDVRDFSVLMYYIER